jgi:alpha-galactosidase
MPSPVQITFVGGGSVHWGPLLTADLMLTEALTGSRLVLYDIDAPAVEQVARLAQRIADETRCGWEIEVHHNLDRALEGSDFVIFCIAQGGLEAFRADLEIPQRYGIVQPVGDTIGPGGISRALRHIPVALDVARKMEDACPRAWFINLTNPLTPITRAVNRETSIQAIGLCHEVTGVVAELAQLLEVSPSRVTVEVAGINHLPWILGMRVGEQDGFEMLREWLQVHGPLSSAQDLPAMSTADSVFYDRMAIKFILFQLCGYLPGAGDRHVAEFFPAFLSAESEYGRSYGVELTTIEHRYERLTQRQQNLTQQIAQAEPLSLEQSGEQVAGLIAALGADQPGRFIINVPNVNQVENLPQGAIVECQAHLRTGVVEPLSVGPLPACIAQIVAGRVWQQEIIVDAAVSGSRGLVLQALLADPMLPSWEITQALCDKLLSAHTRHLSQFSGDIVASES